MQACVSEQKVHRCVKDIGKYSPGIISQGYSQTTLYCHPPYCVFFSEVPKNLHLDACCINRALEMFVHA